MRTVLLLTIATTAISGTASHDNFSQKMKELTERRRAEAAAAGDPRPEGIDEIEHIVIFMQENRAFDHYYGSLPGVRGFADRTATPTRLGGDTFYQPVNTASPPQTTNGTLAGPYMLPFPLRSAETSAMCIPAPAMDFFVNQGIVAEGRFDAWNTARSPGLGLGFFNRSDLPYYYSLFDEWLVGDHYFQSTPTETNPNRLHLFSGTNGLNQEHFPILYDEEPAPGWQWETLAETLEAANVSWRTYQQWDNFDDNGNAWFSLFRDSKPGTPWFDKGMYRAFSMPEEFEKDLKAGTLPQVSWLIAAEFQSEHATNHPAAGEALTANILQILQKYPETYKKTAFILNYDEGGQFFDHLWVPMPPLNPPFDGQSTVSTAGETFECQNFTFLVENNECPPQFHGKPVVNGLGYRVPLLVVSPWTRGAKVSSEIFDHTSVIKLIETRFNVTCPNISPWRRAVVGNLASVFDFAHPNYTWPTLPVPTGKWQIDADVECLTLPPPRIPATQAFPRQERGVRAARPLPYDQNVSMAFHAAGAASTVALTLVGTGQKPSSLMFYNVRDPLSAPPQRFLIEPGKTIVATMAVPTPNNYTLAVHGVNGFVRHFSGTVFPAAGEHLRWIEDKASSTVSIEFTASASAPGPVTLSVVDNAYSLISPATVTVPPGETRRVGPIDVAPSGRWYDLTASREDDTGVAYAQRFMGHVENGTPSISDPAMAAGIPSGLYGPPGLRERPHPPVPEDLRVVPRKEGRAKDAKFHHDEL